MSSAAGRVVPDVLPYVDHPLGLTPSLVDVTTEEPGLAIIDWTVRHEAIRVLAMSYNGQLEGVVAA